MDRGIADETSMKKLISDHGHFSSYEGHMERQTGKISWGFFKDAQGFVTAGCWLARRLQQLKASTTMDLGISIFLIFVRCVALRNLELLIKTGWNVFVRFVAENAGRG